PGVLHHRAGPPFPERDHVRPRPPLLRLLVAEVLLHQAAHRRPADRIHGELRRVLPNGPRACRPEPHHARARAALLRLLAVQVLLRPPGAGAGPRTGASRPPPEPSPSLGTGGTCSRTCRGIPAA